MTMIMTSCRAVTLPLLTLLLPLACRSIHLDIHVPLFKEAGCVAYYALLANRLLRGNSRPTVPPAATEQVPQPSEHVDLFSRDAPHLTLYLADFDLETETEASEENRDGDSDAPRMLNKTKVDLFLDKIGSLNFTEIVARWDCPLSFSKDPSSSSYFQIKGAYVMLPVLNTPCLQTLSTTLLHSLQPYLRHPVVVPTWVASLPEPERSAAIFRSRTYGSPNVLEGFFPHVTVGFDPTGDSSPTVQSSLKRVTTMEQWNLAYEPVHGSCMDEVQGISVGKTGEGGTVLANAIMDSWEIELAGKTKHRGNTPNNAKGLDFDEAVE